MSDVFSWLRARGPAVVIGTTLAAVAGVTGFISYTHICALTLVLHQSWKTAHLMPLAVDGQIVIGSVVYMALDGKSRFWGLVGIVPGLAESLFANWESGIDGGRFAAGWATVAAQAFAVSSFLFERWLRAQVKSTGHAVPAVPAEAVATAPETAAVTPGGTATPLAPEASLLTVLDAVPYRHLGSFFGVPKTRVGNWKKRLEGGEKLVPDASGDVPDDKPEEALTIRYAAMNGSGPHA